MGMPWLPPQSSPAQPFQEAAGDRIGDEPEREADRTAAATGTCPLDASIERLREFGPEMGSEAAWIREEGGRMQGGEERDHWRNPGTSLRLRAAATWSAIRSVSALAMLRPCLVRR